MVKNGTSEHRTDLGNARRLVRHFGERMRFAHEWRKWLVYADGRWRIDGSGEIERMAKETVMRIYAEAIGAATDADRQELAKWAARSESEARIRAAVELASSEPGVPIQSQDLDSDPRLLNVANGTLELRTGRLREHRPADLITKQTPVPYDRDATCPQWVRFLRRILADNGELLGFLQRAVGYSLTGETIEQVLFILWGLGNNGKSVFLDVLRSLLGDYGRAADFATFLEWHSEGARSDVARLQGARFVPAIETGDGQRLAEGLVKKLTGGDVITARFLYAEHFEFQPTFKLWLATNHKPTIRGTDHAMWRRIRLVPFTVTIPEEERDLQLAEKLRAELPGILNWAIEGCLTWQRDGLGVPPAIRAATEAYRSEMDVLGGFLEECCEMGPSYKSFAAALYETYRRWCERSGERALPQRGFGRALQERALIRVKSTGGVMAWFGLRLVEIVDGVDALPGKYPYHRPRGKMPENDPLPPLGPLSNGNRVPREEGVA